MEVEGLISGKFADRFIKTLVWNSAHTILPNIAISFLCPILPDLFVLAGVMSWNLSIGLISAVVNVGYIQSF